jgi:hypothetical protein
MENEHFLVLIIVALSSAHILDETSLKFTPSLVLKKNLKAVKGTRLPPVVAGWSHTTTILFRMFCVYTFRGLEGRVFDTICSTGEY